MCVLLMFLNIYYREKLMFSKLVRKVNFGKKIWRKALGFEEKKRTRYIWENIYFSIIIFSCLSSTKPCLRFLLNCFVWEIKGFYQSSLRNQVDFRDIMNLSPNISAKNKNFKKLRHSFVDDSALTTTTLISSCDSKTLAPFCLQKKRHENVFLTLIVNYRKIIQKNKLCYSK